MRPVQRLAAYALLRPDPGRDEVVLVQASRRSDLAGRWFLPGGGVDHGEYPDAAVVREVAGPAQGLAGHCLHGRPPY